MKKEFVPYELALELKKLGFDKNYFGWYNNERAALSVGETWRASQYAIPAPLWQQAFDWFREKHNLYSNIILYSQNSNNLLYAPMIDIMHPSHKAIVDFDEYTDYNEAKQKCLEKLIEIVKNENKSNL